MGSIDGDTEGLLTGGMDGSSAGLSAGTDVWIHEGDLVGLKVGSELGAIVKRIPPYWWQVPQENRRNTCISALLLG